ncbi:MAG TPA: hypothetical protein VF489_09525 [Sphingobium sp.]
MSIRPNTIVAMEIDGTKIFVPEAWGVTRTDSPRPWRNGVLAGTGGWGQFNPSRGPLGAQDDYGSWPQDGIFRASSEGQKVDPRDPFFWLDITFEFPLPPEKRNWWGGRKNERIDHFATDMLELIFHAPGEKPVPYLALLKGLRPEDGSNLGEGWREVTRPYSNKTLRLRFDATDWRTHGGALPRRLVASYSDDGEFWNHHLALSPRGWVMDFETRHLPLSRWRTRYVTAEALYDWLCTSPEKRDAARRFEWWADIRDRPTH